tara:strand:- start:594 stop:773 length:180 start_codon:yes stop_codon:yes gene_type:complete
MNFNSLRKQAKDKAESLPLTKEECALFLSLVAESNIKIKDIQYVYDLLYRIQEFVQTEE